MKKAMSLSVLILFASLALNAQISKNRSMMGVSTSLSYANFGSDLMNLGFITSKEDGSDSEVKTTVFNLLPKFGYFVADNLALGLNAAIAIYSQNYSGDKSTNTALGIGPFARYYFPGTKVMPFLEATSMFGSVKYSGDSNKTKTSSYGAGAGLAVKIGEKVTFDMLAGYNHLTYKESAGQDEYKSTQGTIGFKFGFVVLFGSNED